MHDYKLIIIVKEHIKSRKKIKKILLTTIYVV